MTQEELDAKIAELRTKYVDPAIEAAAKKVPWVKKHWRELLIGVLVLAVLVFAWRWRVQSGEAERLGRLVRTNDTIEVAEERLRALDARAAAREKEIEAAIEASRRLDKELQDKRDALKKASAARVSQIPKDAAGVAKALTDAGFPAQAVTK